MLTEQPNPQSSTIDQMSTSEITALIAAADRAAFDAVQLALPAINAAIELITTRLEKGGRLFYVGAGTSGRLGVLDAAECVPTFGTPPEVVQGIIAGGQAALTLALEGVEDDAEAGRTDLLARHITAHDCVVGIAASGRTPYVLGALAYAREIGAATVGISCNQPAPVLNAAEIAIPLLTGPEVITGSTRMKAGTAQKLTLNMISTTVMVKLGKVYGNQMVDVQVNNDKLRQRAHRVIAAVTHVTEAHAAELLRQCSDEVKTAIVCARLSISPDAARARLAQANGHLRRVINP